MLFHGSELVVSAPYRELLRKHGLDSVEAVLAKGCPEPPEPKRRSRVREMRLDGSHFFLKTYDYLGLWRLRTLFIPARAKREFRNLVALGHLGMRVPQPVAFGQRRFLGFVTASFLITQAVEGAIDLRELGDGKPAPFALPNRHERRVLLESFAHRLRRCHDARCFLYSPFFKNLLLARENGRHEIFLIDVPFARIWRTRLLPGRSRVRDLACLQQGAMALLSRTERMRFYKTYAAVLRLGPEDKALLRRASDYQRRHYP